jgi:hypothetical protein
VDLKDVDTPVAPNTRHIVAVNALAVLIKQWIHKLETMSHDNDNTAQNQDTDLSPPTPTAPSPVTSTAPAKGRVLPRRNLTTGRRRRGLR